MVLFKCTRKGCDFATSEVYNYCPLCGSITYLFDGDKGIRPGISITGPDSACPMAYQCAGMELHDADCEKLEVRHNCIVGMWHMLECLEHELRTMRRAFEEAGLQVSPRPAADLSWKLTEGNQTSVPEP